MHLPQGAEHRTDAPCATGDRAIGKVLDRYRSQGGLARAHEVVARAARQAGPNAASFTTWMAQRQVVCVQWQAQAWLPLFQFNRFDMHPVPELRQLLAPLNTVLDSWQVAAWFVTPHALLADRVPAGMLARDPAAVLRAAQAVGRAG